MDYKKAGVNLDFADRIPQIINQLKRKISTPGKNAVGGFGGEYRLKFFNNKDLVLVAGADGVGTKTILAQQFNMYSGLGIDLVAMSVNDIACTGAQPLFFLDYIGYYKISEDIFKIIIESILDGCNRAGCVLLGGETAEMPGVYKPGDFDLVGFAVGMTNTKEIIKQSRVRKGNVLLGLPSSGPHSNGFSLIRKVFYKKKKLLRENIEQLLSPTRIYTGIIKKLNSLFKLNGIAHITGGGLPGNLPRIIPKTLGFKLDTQSWPVPDIFRIIQDTGKIKSGEMFRVFNMGLGLVLIVNKKDADSILQYLHKQKEQAFLIGEITGRK